MKHDADPNLPSSDLVEGGGMSHARKLADLRIVYQSALEAYERAKVDRWLMGEQIAEAVVKGRDPSDWEIQEFRARSQVVDVLRDAMETAWQAWRVAL